MNFNGEELMLMMLYNPGTRLGLMQELRLMQCYLLPDETALHELSECVIEKLKLMTDTNALLATSFSSSCLEDRKYRLPHRIVPIPSDHVKPIK